MYIHLAIYFKNNNCINILARMGRVKGCSPPPWTYGIYGVKHKIHQAKTTSGTEPKQDITYVLYAVICSSGVSPLQRLRAAVCSSGVAPLQRLRAAICSSGVVPLQRLRAAGVVCTRARMCMMRARMCTRAHVYDDRWESPVALPYRARGWAEGDTDLGGEGPLSCCTRARRPHTG